MVVGSGMVARAFAAFQVDPAILIFASGVSNSSTATEADHRREHDLLDSQPLLGRRLVYFSTCSIYDPSLTNSPYIRHKRAMEDHVKACTPDHTIFRLPNLVGHTPNPHTLCNFLRDRIQANEPVHLQTRACRYLMDIDAVALACGHMIRNGAFWGQTVNVCIDPSAPLPQLLQEMERILGRTAHRLEEERGACYEVENASFKQFWTMEMGLPWPTGQHWQRVLAKYYAPRPAAGGPWPGATADRPEGNL
ncbi:MAG: NAD-dependent epimerase/dehydratase family protein [Flavobacteriales bacterium]|nr:NAD-dependent epimerase/dehydratase family protein [Flavobacteriales bacterium]MEB2340860.1 NAD-dependent epimerase/dehydratase family protein [Flavobacteriia bacterium]